MAFGNPGARRCGSGTVSSDAGSGVLRLVLMEALQTATWNPARYLEMTDSLGSVAVGMIADLVFLDMDPLENINNTRQIWAVVLDGRVLDSKVFSGVTK